METNEHDKIIAFDTLYTTNHIQMLKIVMPYFDAPSRRKLAVYIKYMEFRYTLSHCPDFHELSGCSFGKEEINIGKLCSELLPFCTGEEKKKLEQIADLFRSMEMYREMSRTMEMMKDLAPDLFTAEGFGKLFSTNNSPEADSQDSADNPGDTNNPSDTDNPDDTDNPGSTENPANGMMEMLMGMLSPEQKAMFEIFGGNTHESDRMDE